MREEEIHIMSSAPDSLRDYIQKIWKFRNLIWVFAKRDLRVKYAQTVIGLGWTIIQPLTALIIYTFFFGFLLNWKTDGISYPIYVLSGLLVWNYFSYIANSGTFGLQESAHLIKKIYFPKSIIPLSKVVFSFIELLINLVLLIPLLLYFGQSISWKIIFIPFIFLFATNLALLFVFIISVMAYKKRDILHLVPFILHFGIWFSPVFFSSDLLPKKYQFIIDLNPIANVIQALRWSLFNFGEFKWIWGLNFGIISLLLIVSMYSYNRLESKFSDLI